MQHDIHCAQAHTHTLAQRLFLVRSMYYYYWFYVFNSNSSQLASQIDGIIDSFDSSLAYNIWPFSHQYSFIHSFIIVVVVIVLAVASPTKLSFIANQPKATVKGYNSYKIKLQTTFIAIADHSFGVSMYVCIAIDFWYNKTYGWNGSTTKYHEARMDGGDDATAQQKCNYTGFHIPIKNESCNEFNDWKKYTFSF